MCVFVCVILISIWLSSFLIRVTTWCARFLCCRFHMGFIRICEDHVHSNRLNECFSFGCKIKRCILFRFCALFDSRYGLFRLFFGNEANESIGWSSLNIKCLLDWWLGSHSGWFEFFGSDSLNQVQNQNRKICQFDPWWSWRHIWATELMYFWKSIQFIKLN